MEDNQSKFNNIYTVSKETGKNSFQSPWSGTNWTKMSNQKSVPKII
jgi:hypothetical protein